MPKFSTILVWAILIPGVAGLLLGEFYTNKTFFTTYKTIIELYIFGFTSFIVLKRVFFYKLKGNVDVIRLVKKSNFQIMLIWQGVILTLIYLVYNLLYFGNLLHFNTIMIAILLLYYIVQLVLNSSPSIYIDENNFSYDDYFVEQWPWQKIERIELENQTLRLVNNQKDFELDFDLVDEIDYIKLNEEVEHNILDGDFASEETSKSLIEIVQTYANLYNVRLVNSTNRVI